MNKTQLEVDPLCHYVPSYDNFTNIYNTNEQYTFKNICNYQNISYNQTETSNNDNKLNNDSNNGNKSINDCNNHNNGIDNGNNDVINNDDIKPDIKKKKGKQSSYWNKKVDKNYPFYGCSICNISFMEIHELDQHVLIHANRITSYDLRQINKKKRKKLKKEMKKMKKVSKIKKESEIEIKPEEGYIGNETTTEYTQKNDNDHNNGINDTDNGNNGIMNNGNNDNNGINNDNGKKCTDEDKYVKLYKCFACNKEFALSYYLKIHVRSHTDDKPYSCKLCNQSFITASKLGRHHKRTHVQSARKQCRICYRLFSRFDLLVAHFDKFHAEHKLEGEPYDYNAILPYLQELEEQMKQEEVKDVKPKVEDSFPAKDNNSNTEESKEVVHEKIMLPTSDCENETNIMIEEIKVFTEIKCESNDTEINVVTELTDYPIVTEFPVVTDYPVVEEAEQNNTNEDIKCEDSMSSDSDYFPSDSCAAPPSPGAGAAPPAAAQCDVCNKTFSSKSYLRVHMRTHTGEKPFRCYICGRGFITANKMHRHVLTHEETWNGDDAIRPEGDIKSECDTDDDKGKPKKKITKSKSKLLKKSKNKETVKKKYTKRPHVCEFCHKKFLHIETLQIHRKTHEGEELVYKCNYCLEPQLDPDALKEHESTHTGPRPYLCTDCGKTYMKRESMVYHKKTHKQSSNETFICDICSKSFTSTQKLQKHMISHTTDKFVLRYECPVCAHMFHTKYHTAMHLSTHMKEGLISEENRNAVLAMVLQNARKIPVSNNGKSNITDTIPTDERSRICNICGQIFQHFYYLEEHLKTHASKIAIENVETEENKKYKCQICSKSFKLHYYLKLHNFTHSNEKPFICQQCGKGFITKGKLKRHLETHQGIKKYQCHICYKFFTRPSYLRIHVRTIHGTQDYNLRDYGLGVPLNSLVMDVN